MRKLQCEVCVLLNRMLYFDNKIIYGNPFLFVALLFIFFLFKIHSTVVLHLSEVPLLIKTAFQLTFFRLFYPPEKKSSTYKHFRFYFFFTE